MASLSYRSVLTLSAFIITVGAPMAVALPAQAAGPWSAPVPLPAGAGFSENPSGAQLVVTGTGPQVSSSPDGLTWSTPVTIGQGGTGAVTALAPHGQGVTAWVAGTTSAPVIQASVRPPGGTWSSPVTVGGDGAFAPLIGIDAAGDAIVTWKGSTGTISTGPVYAASLPAGGKWTAPAELTTAGGPVQMAVNAAGQVVIAWGAKAHAAWADSGTILGGFAVPVMVGPSSYGHTLTSPKVALNSAGKAVLAWAGPNSALAATRTASGQWSAPASPACADAFSAAVDGAGDAIVTCEEAVLNPLGQYVTSYYTTRLAAGSTTWGTPVLLTGDFLSGGFYSAADAAGTFVIAVKDSTAKSLVTFTSAPGAGFGPGTPLGDLTSNITSLNLTVPGRATLVWASSAGASEATEPVS
ncbi:MAG TPA: hypothetical protein VGS19_34925 [Streptosporangiaceae bacterium]|nr:hypothetical protein [Streptosporangiaceae bacterium]